VESAGRKVKAVGQFNLFVSLSDEHPLTPARPILVFPPRPRPRNHILDYSQVAFAAAGDALLPEIIIGLLERVADPKIPVVNSQRRTDEANQKSFLSPSYSQCLYRVPDTW